MQLVENAQLRDVSAIHQLHRLQVYTIEVFLIDADVIVCVGTALAKSSRHPYTSR